MQNKGSVNLSVKYVSRFKDGADRLMLDCSFLFIPTFLIPPILNLRKVDYLRIYKKQIEKNKVGTNKYKY